MPCSIYLDVSKYVSYFVMKVSIVYLSLVSQNMNLDISYNYIMLQIVKVWLLHCLCSWWPYKGLTTCVKAYMEYSWHIFDMKSQEASNGGGVLC